MLFLSLFFCPNLNCCFGVVSLLGFIIFMGVNAANPVVEFGIFAHPLHHRLFVLLATLTQFPFMNINLP